MHSSSIDAIIRYYGLSDSFFVSLIRDMFESFSYAGSDFNDYWFANPANYYGVSGLLIALFVLQISVLAAGFASFFTQRVILGKLPPIILEGLVIEHMWLFFARFDAYIHPTLEIGFVFAVAAGIALIISLARNFASRHRSHLSSGSSRASAWLSRNWRRFWIGNA